MPSPHPDRLAVQNSGLAPALLAPPAANYAHGVLTVGASRLIHTSGVVPTRPDGSVPTTIGAQAETVWENLLAILAEGAMGPTNVVSVTTWVVDGASIDDDLPVVMAARDRALGGHLAASILVVVPRLARPVWKMEIALVAAA